MIYMNEGWLFIKTLCAHLCFFHSAIILPDIVFNKWIVLQISGYAKMFSMLELDKLFHPTLSWAC